MHSTEDKPRPSVRRVRSFNLRRRLGLSHAGARGLPLRKIHVSLYTSDIEFLKQRYGRRHDTAICEIVHSEVNRLRRAKAECPDLFRALVMRYRGVVVEGCDH